MRTWILVLAVAVVACSTVPPLDRGLDLSQRGQDLAAKSAFDEAIRRSPESAPAYANRGNVRARLGDLDGAIADYTKALELGLRRGDVLFNRCLALVSKRAYQGAITDCTAVLAENPRHADALFARGSARWLSGDAEQARVDWLRAIELEPDLRQKTRMLTAIDRAPASAAPAFPRAAPARTSNPTPPAGAPEGLDSRALAARGLDRELKGDRPGAIADLHAALAAEPDPERQQGIRNLLRLLGAR